MVLMIKHHFLYHLLFFTNFSLYSHMSIIFSNTSTDNFVTPLSYLAYCCCLIPNFSASSFWVNPFSFLIFFRFTINLTCKDYRVFHFLLHTLHYSLNKRLDGPLKDEPKIDKDIYFHFH